MVKILSEREISSEESPIMLQGRHTVMEVDKDCNLKEPNLKTITRSSSTNSINETRNQEQNEIPPKNPYDATLSPEGPVSASNASAVVITESELSSSWLYNDKKAQMKSPVASNIISPSRLAEMNDVMKSSMLPRSNMSTVKERKKRSSCCCYTSIILIISLVALGILAAIASIFYMELFASYNGTDTQIKTTKPLKKIGHSLGEESQKISNRTKLVEKTSESVHFTDSSAKFPEKVMSRNLGFDTAKVDENRSIINKSESSSMMSKILNLTSQMMQTVTSVQTRDLNQINALLSGNSNFESYYSKLFDLYQGIRSANTRGEKDVKSEPNDPASQTTGIPNINYPNTLSSMHLSEIENTKSDEKTHFNDTNSFATVDFSPSQFSQATSVNKEDITKNLYAIDDDYSEKNTHFDKKFKNSSVVFVDTKHLFSDSNKIAMGLTDAEDISTNLPTLEDNSNELKINNIVGEDNLQDFNMPLSNPSKESAFKPKSEFNLEFDEIKTFPDLIVGNDSYNPIPQPSEEENLESQNLFRTLELDFEGDGHNNEQSKTPNFDQPLVISKFNQEFDENKTFPDLLEKNESDNPIPQSSEEKLDSRNLFRNSEIDFEEDGNTNEQSKDPDLDRPMVNLPISGIPNISNLIPNFLSRLDRSWGFSNFLRNPDDNLKNDVPQKQVSADETDSVDLNLPVLETNIAVPRPVEISRRFGLIDDNKNDQIYLMQQERQFSLAKALDMLSLLDVNNVLPSSRKSKSASLKEKARLQSNEEVTTEQSHYLETLKKVLFDG